MILWALKTRRHTHVCFINFLSQFKNQDSPYPSLRKLWKGEREDTEKIGRENKWVKEWLKGNLYVEKKQLSGESREIQIHSQDHRQTVYRLSEDYSEYRLQWK